MSYDVNADIPGNRHSAGFDDLDDALVYFLKTCQVAWEGRVSLVYTGEEYEEE